jgi:hypothetical protein
MSNKKFSTRLIKLVNRIVFFAICVTYFGAIGAQTIKPAAPNIPSAKAKLDEFVQIETEAVNSLRGGVSRLSRLCATPLKPLVGVATGNSDLRDLSAQVQVRGALLITIADQQLGLADQSVQESQKEQDQACAASSNWLFALINKATKPESVALCDSRRTRAAATKVTRNLVSKWRELQRERQQLFQQLIQLEMSDCTRPGFAQRMIQTHESSLGPYEEQLPALVEAARSAP